MANVFVSVLGTNNYVPCSYNFDDEVVVKNARFVQEATVSRCCKDWSESDRILIFTTDEAEKKNWLDNGQIDPETNEPIIQQGLKSRLDALGLSAAVTNVKIPEGKTESEIWEIFNAILGRLGQGDEVVFDITHAFRSIPMLVMVVLNYAKVVKGVKLLGIYYGAFEVLGSPKKVAQMPMEKRIAPIFDLTPFDRLMDWTTAIGAFMRSGDATLATDLAGAQAREILKKTRGSNEEARRLRHVAEQLRVFSQDASTCRGLDLSNDIVRLKQALEASKDCPISPAFVPLLEQLRKRLEVFTGHEVMDGIRLAQWCAEHNLIQQGYTILRECLITYVCKGYGVDLADFDARERITKAIGEDLHAWHKRHEKKRVSGNAETPPLSVFQDKLDLLKVFDKLFWLRNDINHAGMRKKPSKATTLKDELDKLIDDVRRLLLE